MHNPNFQKKQPLWCKDSWRDFPIKQQPTYANRLYLEQIEKQLELLPGLVSVAEIERLKAQLLQAERGKAFILQAGDCAESFAEFSQENLQKLLFIITQMSRVLKLKRQCPIIAIGRIAGQFAKPRSVAKEMRDGVALPSYQGDMVNSLEFDILARQADPQRLLQGYYHSTAILNYLRTVATNDLELFTSHEALILNYEQQFLSQDNGKYYDLSAHMLWIGNRTNSVSGAHIEFAKGINNPIGIKIDCDMKPDDLLELSHVLNPLNEAGRLVAITRMGVKHIDKFLPALVTKLQVAKRQVIWMCDPMHGNTTKLANGYKTRAMDDIISEMQQFFAIHKRLGSYGAGLHLEMTGQDVTECTGGAQKIAIADLERCYLTHCDPRLNAQQALELVSISF
jgi:3-deoxy-7-phosphoheptulonate synthase